VTSLRDAIHNLVSISANRDGQIRRALREHARCRSLGTRRDDVIVATPSWRHCTYIGAHAPLRGGKRPDQSSISRGRSRVETSLHQRPPRFFASRFRQADICRPEGKLAAMSARSIGSAGSSFSIGEGKRKRNIKKIEKCVE